MQTGWKFIAQINIIMTREKTGAIKRTCSIPIMNKPSCEFIHKWIKIEDVDGHLPNNLDRLETDVEKWEIST